MCVNLHCIIENGELLEGVEVLVGRKAFQLLICRLVGEHYVPMLDGEDHYKPHEQNDENNVQQRDNGTFNKTRTKVSLLVAHLYHVLNRECQRHY